MYESLSGSDRTVFSPCVGASRIRRDQMTLTLLGCSEITEDLLTLMVVFIKVTGNRVPDQHPESRQGINRRPFYLSFSFFPFDKFRIPAK